MSLSSWPMMGRVLKNKNRNKRTEWFLKLLRWTNSSGLRMKASGLKTVRGECFLFYREESFHKGWVADTLASKELLIFLQMHSGSWSSNECPCFDGIWLVLYDCSIDLNGQCICWGQRTIGKYRRHVFMYDHLLKQKYVFCLSWQ